MPPPEIWGPPVWTFFHTLAENIDEENFLNLKNSLFNIIRRICTFLPCPDCSQHAIHFLAKININKIKNKTEFKNMLYVFHNTVNKKKNKQLFSHSQLDKYKQYNIGTSFNHFVRVYHTKGNMNQLAESFQRKLLLVDLKNWLINNSKYFKPKKTTSEPVNNPNT
jgi:Erv1 / Alr family